MISVAIGSKISMPVTLCRTNAASASDAPSTSIVSSRYTVVTVGSLLSARYWRMGMPARVARPRSSRTATVRLMPSKMMAITRTVTPTQNASSSRGWTSALMPSQIDTAPPTTNIPTAASSAQYQRSGP